ncbi:hypothetical protein LJR175_008416 [Variovorax sp. LjRoot175]|uniref:hypothetical protein n=1 Tax=Variovorax sp. LjRoot175 TaxID=3342276 RepID=UPI003ECFF85E
MTKRSRTFQIAGGALGVALLVAAGAVVFLANQRGTEIARERAKLEQSASAAELVKAFRASKTVLAMSDGTLRHLDGAAATLLWTKPEASEPGAWLAVGRSSGGAYFGQRFSRDEKGAFLAQAEAREVSAAFALRELQAQIVAAGADEEAAGAFLRAAETGKAAEIRR